MIYNYGALRQAQCFTVNFEEGERDKIMVFHTHNHKA